MNSEYFNLEKTKNNFGYQHLNSYISRAFIDFATRASYPVLDISAAFGVAVHPCLEKGTEVIAVDICADNLAELWARTPKRACK